MLLADGLIFNNKLNIMKKISFFVNFLWVIAFVTNFSNVSYSQGPPPSFYYKATIVDLTSNLTYSYVEIVDEYDNSYIVSSYLGEGVLGTFSAGSGGPHYTMNFYATGPNGLAGNSITVNIQKRNASNNSLIQDYGDFQLTTDSNGYADTLLYITDYY
jgi:hypothetical protein